MTENEQQLLEGEMRAEAVREELLAEQVAEERAQDFEEETLLAEQARANQLVADQEESFLKQEQADEILQEGLSFGRPSPIKWAILFNLAIMNDVVDILDLTGIGAILAWLISLGLTVSILLILWFTDGKFKRAQKFVASLGQPLIESAGRTGLRKELALKMTGPSSRAIKRDAIKKRLEFLKGSEGFKLSTFTSKNPLIKSIVGSGVESLPFIGAINPVIIWIIMAYLDERNTYKRAQKAAQEVSNELLKEAAEVV